MNRFRILFVLAVLLCTVSSSGWAQQGSPELSRFLDPYPPLTPLDDESGALMWRKDTLEEKYVRIMIEQPEIFLHPESQYKGIKPDQMKVLADSFREAFATKITDTYEVVNEPGPGTVLVRFALTNVYMKKSGFRIRNITPVGFAAYAVKNAVGKGVSLVEATVEGEVLDSQTGERQAAIVNKLGQHKDKEKKLKEDKTSWDDVEEAINDLAERVKRRLDWFRDQAQ